MADFRTFDAGTALIKKRELTADWKVKTMRKTLRPSILTKRTQCNNNNNNNNNNNTYRDTIECVLKYTLTFAKKWEQN